MNSRSVAGSFPHQGDPERLAYTVSLNSLAGLDVTSVPVTCSSAWGTGGLGRDAATSRARLWQPGHVAACLRPDPGTPWNAGARFFRVIPYVALAHGADDTLSGYGASLRQPFSVPLTAA
jgi:hypothetical protein